MGIKREGIQPQMKTIPTPFNSMNYALGGGLPVGVMWELYGNEQVGKSTFAYFAAGLTQPEEGFIDIVDLEGHIDPPYVEMILENSANFSGTVAYLPKKMPKKDVVITHEMLLQEMKTDLTKPEVSAGIFDSIGALVPNMEREGDFGDAFIGRRAMLVGQFVRAGIYAINRGRPPGACEANVFLINHLQPKIGGRGFNTPGGVAPKYLCSVRIFFYKGERFGNDGEDGFEIRGRTDKLAYNRVGRIFRLFVLSDYGIHVGLTAVLDALDLGIATKSGGVVKLLDDEKTSIGKMATLIRKAREGDNDIFQPVIDAVKLSYDEINSSDAPERKRPTIIEDEDEQDQP